MDTKIVLGRLLQKFMDAGYSKYLNYNQFGYVRHTNKSVTVSREDGADTSIPFSRLLIAIKGYQDDDGLYDRNTTALRSMGITHITSPVYSFLHLLTKEAYKK